MNTTNNLKTKNIVVTRVFDAPVEQIWKAWSYPGYVRQWWGPTGFTCTLAEMDFREGGTSLVCMRAPKEFGGQDMYNTWTYKKITPMQQIEFIQNFADKDGNKVDPALHGLPPDAPREVRNLVTFKALGDDPSIPYRAQAGPGTGKTEMTVTEFERKNDMNTSIQKITPFLWFDTQAEEAANFYTSIFKNSKITNVAR